MQIQITAEADKLKYWGLNEIYIDGSLIDNGCEIEARRGLSRSGDDGYLFEGTWRFGKRTQISSNDWHLQLNMVKELKIKPSEAIKLLSDKIGDRLNGLDVDKYIRDIRG